LLIKGADVVGMVAGAIKASDKIVDTAKTVKKYRMQSRMLSLRQKVSIKSLTPENPPQKLRRI